MASSSLSIDLSHRDPRQLTPINHFLEDAGRGRDLGHT